jgi:hypothetical protein
VSSTRAQVVAIPTLVAANSVDLEGSMADLSRWPGFVVSKGVVHRTRAPERTAMILVEGTGIVPIGD